MSSSSLSVASPPAVEREARVARVPDRLLRVGAAIGACFAIALLVLLNAFPQWVGVFVSLDQPVTFVPLLGPGFTQGVLVWINVGLALGLTLNLVHIGLGRWTLVTRWADVGLSLYACAILWMLATGEAILASGLERALRGTTGLGPFFSAFPQVGAHAPAWVVLWLAFCIALLVAAVKFVAALVRTVRG